MIASGVTNISEIARKFGIRWEIAKDEIKLGNILFNYELSPQNIAKRRKKVNNKLISIAEDAKAKCEQLLEIGAIKAAADFYKIYADIWATSLPNIWGLNDIGFNKSNVTNIHTDQVNFNKIDMTVDSKKGKEMGEKLFNLAEESGLKIK